MLRGSLDGSRVWGRMDTCVCMAESLHCSFETVTTLLISYTQVQNKKLKINKEMIRQKKSLSNALAFMILSKGTCVLCCAQSLSHV